MTVESCSICQHSIEATDIVAEFDGWRLVVNWSQNYLGKCMLVLRRHEADVTRLTPPEQAEFWQILAKVHQALDRLFAPDHYNYAFLMNENRHVHLHVIPRYAKSRHFDGLTFEDGRLNEHYRLSQRIVAPPVRAQLALALRKTLETTS